MLMVTAALVMALMMAAAGPASANSQNASERACVGAFVSENAPLAEFIREETRTFHPFGQNIARPFATACEFQGGE
jgi:hypothetical protein